MLCFGTDSGNRKKALHSRGSSQPPRRAWLYGVLLLLICGGVGIAESRASACGTMILDSNGQGQAGENSASLSSAIRMNQQGPVIVDSGYTTPAGVASSRDAQPTFMWLQFLEPPATARGVVLESVWGMGPDSLAGMWGRTLPLRDGHVQMEPHGLAPHRDQAFTLGVRARFVLQDGSLSAPSLPVFISHAGQTKHHDGVGADSVLLFLCCAALFGLWVSYKREDDPVYRIRIAAGTALLSLFFLSVAPALSWMSVEDESGRLATVECHLGDEAQCATYVPDSGPNPMSTSDVATERRFELAGWMGASAALRVGLVWCLVLLLPALIWLMVVPTLRPAQTVVAFGASAAGYTFLSALFYRLCTPSWMNVEATRAFDLTLLTSGTIFFAIGLIIKWSLRLTTESESQLPAAVARRI